MNDDIERLLLRREGFLLPRPGRPGAGSPAFVGKVVSTGTNIAAGKFLLVNPTDVTGAEAEGGAGTFAADTSRTVPVYLARGAPATGDYLICRWANYRWVAERPAAPASSGVGPLCNCPSVPASVSSSTVLKIGTTTTATLNYVPSGGTPSGYPAMPPAANRPTPAYYGPMSVSGPNQGITSYSYSYISCFNSTFTQNSVTFNNFGNVVATTTDWTWVIGQNGSSCSPFLLIGGQGSSTATQVESITISG